MKHLGQALIQLMKALLLKNIAVGHLELHRDFKKLDQLQQMLGF